MIKIRSKHRLKEGHYLAKNRYLSKANLYKRKPEFSKEFVRKLAFNFKCQRIHSSGYITFFTIKYKPRD